MGWCLVFHDCMTIITTEFGTCRLLRSAGPHWRNGVISHGADPGFVNFLWLCIYNQDKNNHSHAAHTNHGNELSRETIRNKYCFTLLLLLLLLILGLHFALLLTFFLEGELRPKPNKGHATSEQIL